MLNLFGFHVDQAYDDETVPSSNNYTIKKSYATGQIAPLVGSFGRVGGAIWPVI